MYSAERNVQILLALFKAHGIKKMVLSPGSANASFVASAQADGDFELYSCVDERSAAYIACGLAEESNEPVVICCTGATASRNYMPGLTEAFYRKLPIVAVTATRPIVWLGQHRDQLIDRTVIPNDIAVKSVHLPIVENDDTAWECNLKVNDALLELMRNGNGPVHINLTTSYSIDFSIKSLPSERVIRRYHSGDHLPQIPSGSVAVFVGAHSVWSNALREYVDTFCEHYNAVVFYDQTSNYSGKYGIPCGMFDIAGFPYVNVDFMIHLGNISASWPTVPKQVWRVNIDGEIRDTYRRLTSVFEMREEDFFKYYCEIGSGYHITQFEKWNAAYNNLLASMISDDEKMTFSSLWIAQNLHDRLPDNAVVHYGILNSLRCWNCYRINKSIRGYSNTGGFGIDGGVSTLIGASLCDQEKLYFGIFGDLAFFYDMNSLGNRHVGSNVRIMVANNGLGGEFKNALGNVQRAGLGNSANEYIAAYGHYGEKSPELVNHFAQDLGFKYLRADSKDSFKKAVDEFVSPERQSKPLLLEVFLNDYEDVEAISLLQAKGSIYECDSGVFGKAKKLAKGILGDDSVKLIKKVIYNT